MREEARAVCGAGRWLVGGWWEGLGSVVWAGVVPGGGWVVQRVGRVWARVGGGRGRRPRGSDGWASMSGRCRAWWSVSAGCQVGGAGVIARGRDAAWAGVRCPEGLGQGARVAGCRG